MALIVIGTKLRQNPKNNNNYRITVIVDNDPANEVDSIDLKFLMEGNPNPKPNPSSMTLKKNKEKDNFKLFRYGKLNFGDANPIGATYTIQSTMKNAEGAVIGSSVDEAIIVESNAGVVVSSISLRENEPSSNKFTFQTVIKGDLAKVAKCKVTLKPAEVGASAANPTTYECVVTKVTNKIKVLENNSVTFQEPDKTNKVLYMTYIASIDLINDQGVVIDELDEEVTAEE